VQSGVGVVDPGRPQEAAQLARLVAQDALSAADFARAASLTRSASQAAARFVRPEVWFAMCWDRAASCRARANDRSLKVGSSRVNMSTRLSKVVRLGILVVGSTLMHVVGF
jgi:hypothetical protein